jgi:arylsulfatase A-like enzyme
MIYQISLWFRTGILVLVGLLHSTCLGFEVNRADEVAAPNLILMMVDDMGFSDIGCYGGEIDTPNIDRMAANGLRFSQFYNNAKCTTTRASVLSGMYPRGKGDRIPDTIPTLAEVLRGCGYQTAMSGKWHLGSKAPDRPIDRGFDEYYGLMDGCCNFFDPSQRDPDFKGGRLRAFGHNDRLIHTFPDGYYTTDAFTEHSIETIRRFAKEKRPFFLHLSYTAPHYPLHAFPEDIAKYRGMYRDGWFALREIRYRRLAQLGLFERLPELSGTDSKAYDWRTADQDWEDLRMATYAAMLDRVDQNVGRLLQTLDELSIAENTLILFLSDNGGCTEEPGGRDPSQPPGIQSSYTAVGPAWGWAQNTPFRRYKSWVHEGGISTPMIAYFPGAIQPATVTSQIGHVIDILPTLLELAGGEYPVEFNGRPALPIEGKSLVPIFQGRSRESPEFLCWEWGGNSAIRRGPWKLVFDKLNSTNQWELYHIESDRTERNDLASRHPELVLELAAEYGVWAKSTGRRVPQANLPVAVGTNAAD